MSQKPRPLEESRIATVVSLEDARQRKVVDRIFERHRDYLRGLAHKLCRSQFDPDDLVQDVLEKLLRAPMPEGANERAWLARMTSNLFIDKLRRQATRREDPLVAEPVALAYEAASWWESLTADDIRAQLAHLPHDLRTTFELFAFARKSYDEIAAQLGIAKATVGTRILRARQRLRDRLAKEHGGG